MNRPGKIVCVGRNYVAHAAELGHTVPSAPLIFLKPPSAVIGAGDAIVLTPQSEQVEHEAEIGVVIGRRMARSNDDRTDDELLAAVAGLTCVNDVTARDLQRADDQWTRAKGFDTFCPIGPRVVPLADLPALDELEVWARVNGTVRQHGHARDMAFSVPTLLRYISSVMSLEPDDIVATGTPAGVGPLAAGDRVEVEVLGVGVLENPVIAPNP